MDVKSKCISSLAAVALVVGFSTTAIAETQTNPAVQVGTQESTAQPEAPKSVGVDQGIAFTAKVINIDEANRVITIETPDGKTMDIPATADVPNFENIKVGDNANVGIYQSLVIYEGVPGDKPEMDAGEVITHSTTNGKPGSQLIKALDVSVEVKAINKETREVTIVLPDGTETTATADPADPVFDQVKVGDNVHVRLIQAFAIEVVAAEATE